MPEFLINASCKGHRPPHLSLRHQVSRPAIIAKLLRERHVGRFLVAPQGFGKTAIALEYCETVFKFSQVYWLNAQSPCFLRDLDRHIIAQTLLHFDDRAKLMVIDDIPALDSERVEILLKEIDYLLAHECEVLITCTPAHDAFHKHHDRVILGASDLLVGEDEIACHPNAAMASTNSPSALPASQRIAALVWGDHVQKDRFLMSIAEEELPQDLSLLIFIMFVLQTGLLSDIDAFVSIDNESLTLLKTCYPYLGIDSRHERFVCPVFSIEKLASVFAAKIDALAASSLFGDRDTLLSHLANAVMKQRRYDEACVLARVLLPCTARGTWLSKRGLTLLDQACLAPACELYHSLGAKYTHSKTELTTGEALRQSFLKNHQAALKAAHQVMESPDGSVLLKITAALVVANSGDDDERDRALQCAQKLCTLATPQSTPCSPTFHQERQSLAAAYAVKCALSQSCEDGAQTWLECYKRGVRGRALLISAAWVLSCATTAVTCKGSPHTLSDKDKLFSPALEKMAKQIISYIADEGIDQWGLFKAMVGIALDRAIERGALRTATSSVKLTCFARQVEFAIFAQQKTTHSVPPCGEERLAQNTPFPSTMHLSPHISVLGTSEPLLTVNLFGGLEVRIGDKRVDASRFRRQKVKTLLALLVLNRGREYSRDTLVSLLWPESDQECARKNFYGIWSLLRKALKTPAGTCPYLIKQQNSLRIDASLLSSDVMQLDEICKTLLFEQAGYGGWSYLFSQVNDLFSSELLPSESANEAIERRRAACRTKLVDALIAASKRLVKAGEVREGLWFARAAHERDESREDVYLALIEAQLKAGQRTAALESYFLCRHFLSNELGLDPSNDVMRLYHSIIESEEQIS